MFAITLTFYLLLSTTTFALPASKEHLVQRVAHRASGLTHFPNPNRAIPHPGIWTEAESNSVRVELSNNWSGAVLVSGLKSFKSVTGTFTVPTPRQPPNSSGTHSASAWVGIDGHTCGSAILQTGVDFTVSDSQTSFDAWFAWFPDSAHDFTGFTVRAGDSITASVDATSATGGSATLINHSTGQQVSHTFSGQPSLCQENAEWIVEDFSDAGDDSASIVPLADWESITFGGASAGLASGGSENPFGATIVNMEQNGRVLTSVSASAFSVTVQYNVSEDSIGVTTSTDMEKNGDMLTSGSLSTPSSVNADYVGGCFFGCL